MSPTFDKIVPIIKQWRSDHDMFFREYLRHQENWLLINRDLKGKVRLILPAHVEDGKQRKEWDDMASKLMNSLGGHASQEGTAIIFESDKEQAFQGASYRLLDDKYENIWVLDRQITEADWANVAPEATGAPRIVFFSIKGGVGRSTALAASAWSLAQKGHRVLVPDMDLESPGLASALLPSERQPTYGITDWLVEDLVDNADSIVSDMYATSELSHDGEIYVVPAHGKELGEYIQKLGRAWMSKPQDNGTIEKWPQRLERLLQKLEENIKPDVILIDSRSGIDEIASACITQIGAKQILLFALDDDQTWNGYKLLFEYWLQAQAAEKIRDRLQVVGALVQKEGGVDYLISLRENSYNTFELLYDEIPSQKFATGFNFDVADEDAPHFPLPIRWNPNFAGLRSLRGRLSTVDAHEVQSVFGNLPDILSGLIEGRKRS